MNISIYTVLFQCHTRFSFNFYHLDLIWFSSLSFSFGFSFCEFFRSWLFYFTFSYLFLLQQLITTIRLIHFDSLDFIFLFFSGEKKKLINFPDHLIFVMLCVCVPLTLWWEPFERWANGPDVTTTIFMTYVGDDVLLAVYAVPKKKGFKGKRPATATPDKFDCCHALQKASIFPLVDDIKRQTKKKKSLKNVQSFFFSSTTFCRLFSFENRNLKVFDQFLQFVSEDMATQNVGKTEKKLYTFFLGRNKIFNVLSK